MNWDNSPIFGLWLKLMGLQKYGDQIYFTLFFLGAVLAISYIWFGPRKSK